MARTKAKVTTSDIYARLARGECANYRQNGCRGQSPCTIIVGEPCDYFTRYVKPLLDYPEFSAKYQREAKVTLAINPNAKIIRARRAGAEPRLVLEDRVPTEAVAPQPAKAAAAKPKKAATPATPSEKPAASPTLPATPPAATPAKSARRKATAAPAAPALLVTAESAAPKARRSPAVPIPPPAPQFALEFAPPGVPTRKTTRKR